MRSALLLLVCCFSSISLAQDFSQLSSLNDLQKKAKSSIQLPEQPEIEHAVNEDEYIVGPGDVFTIIIGGQADDERQCMVTPEGKLLLAAIGSARQSLYCATGWRPSIWRMIYKSHSLRSACFAWRSAALSIIPEW